MNKTKEVCYQTDILVVGAGLAGMRAAHGAKVTNPDLNVLVVDKGPASWGGLMACSGGDYDAVLPEENIDDWIRDWVYYFDGLCDQELMETIWKDSYERLKEYQEWGCTYLSNENGEINGKGVPQRGLEHIKLYVTAEKGSGGLRMANALAKEIKKDGVESIGHVHLTDLVKNDEGKVIGAVGFHVREGYFVRIQAKAVLIATGLGGWKCSYMKHSSSGEGLHMAYKAGAQMRNFEFCRVWNVPKLFAWEGQTTLLPLGARFVNAEGEEFMDRYCASIGGNTDPHYTTIAMAKEIRAGRGPIYFDSSKLREEDAPVYMPKLGWQKINYNRLKDDLGIDFFNSRTEWMPQALMPYGGICADLKGATCVDGLFAAGRCRSIDPGVYTGGFSLSSATGTGHIAGVAMAEYIAQNNTPLEELDDGIVADYRKAMFAPMDSGGLHYKDVLRAIQGIVFPYDVTILKTEASLKNALHKLETLKAEVLCNMGASDSHYLMKLNETLAIAFTAEMYLKASLARTESRAGHYREDYPDHDDNWLKWVILQQGEDGEVALSTKDVPISTYKFPVERYYQDQFDFSTKVKVPTEAIAQELPEET